MYLHLELHLFLKICVLTSRIMYLHKDLCLPWDDPCTFLEHYTFTLGFVLFTLDVMTLHYELDIALGFTSVALGIVTPS